MTTEQLRQQIRTGRQQLQQQRQQLQQQNIPLQTQRQLRKATPLSQVKQRQKRRLFGEAKSKALGQLKQKELAFEKKAKEIEAKIKAYERAQQEARDWAQAEAMIRKGKAWATRGSPIYSKVRYLLDKGGYAELTRPEGFGHRRPTETKAYWEQKQKELQAELQSGAVVSESLLRDIEKERPDLLKNISGYVPQEQMTLASELNKGRIGLDRPIISGKEFEQTGFRKGRKFGFSVVDKDTPISWTKAVDFGQEISRQRTAQNITPKWRSVFELQDIEDLQKTQAIQKASYGQILASGDLPSLIRKPFLDVGEKSVGTTYKGVFGKELPASKRREWGVLLGDTALLGFFSPFMDVGGAKKGKQKVKIKTDKEKKKALEKAIKFLQRETSGTRNVKGVKQVRVLNRNELLQQRLRDYEKVMRQISKETNLAKRREMFNKANKVFEQAWGDDALKVSQEWASQQGLSFNYGKVKTPTGEFKLQIDMTTAPKLKEAVIPSKALDVFRTKQPKFRDIILDVEKVGQVSWLAPRTAVSSATTLKTKTDTLQKTQQKLRTDLLSASLQVPRTTTQQQSQLLTRQLGRTALIPKTTTKTDTTQTTRTISTNILMPRIPTRTRITMKPKPRIKTPPFIWLGGGSPQKRRRRRLTPKRRKQSLFLVEVKQKGKYKPFAFAKTKRGAFLKGKKRVKSTLEASFRVRTRKGIVPLSPTRELRRSRSRRDFGTLVQRKTKDPFGFGSRLGTRSEIQAIKRARKKKKKPIKKKKASRKKKKK